MESILGFSSYLCDSAATLLVDGKLAMAVEEERFVREKHTLKFPVHAIKNCMEGSTIQLRDLDYIAFHFNPYYAILHRIPFLLRYFPKNLKYLKAKQGQALSKMLFLKREFIKEMNGNKSTLNHTKIRFVNHHLSHACSTFFTSPYEEASILTFDGGGEIASTALHTGENNRIKTVWTRNAPHSLGCFYSTFTEFLGFKRERDEGKVMGLAPYGKPVLTDEFNDIINIGDDGGFSLNMDYFSYQYGSDIWYSKKLTDTFGEPRVPESDITQKHMDIAATLQFYLEKAGVALAKRLYEVNPSDNLCLAGGVALNSVLNSKIFQETKFKNIFIMPAASDAGTSLGNTLYVYNMVLNKPRLDAMDTAYWGPEYGENEIVATLERNSDTIDYRKSGDVSKVAAELLARHKIIGWYQGRMEFGPRALGNRSILANPARAEMKDILNARIKFRESFRPFAPSVPLDKVGEYFKFDHASPFMLLVVDVREEMLNRIPAIVHVDGTARVQTVTESQNTLYWNLIKEFGKLSGIEVVLNTSFNVRGEPIVNTPEEAVKCFLKTGMDNLIIGGYVVSKKNV